ncbi:arginine repressor [Pediococcus siamensis]|uniref:arginine repressor n=1 Tax=Pediococcus siamensis TaxID=381829 RepID=UPI0039A117F7
MKKSERQKIVTDLIMNQPIAKQDDLMQLLKEHGVVATQATISRDMRELHIVKGADREGKQRYMIFQASPEDPTELMFKTFAKIAKQIDQIQFVNIIKTTPNEGNRLAAVLDETTLPEIVGTLAGFDTIVIFSPNETLATNLNHKLTKYLNNENK